MWVCKIKTSREGFADWESICVFSDWDHFFKKLFKVMTDMTEGPASQRAILDKAVQ